MPCFGWGFIEHFLIWLVVVVTVLAIIRVLMRLAASAAPAEFQWLISATMEIIKIVLYAAIIIAVIVLVFGILGCIVPLRL